jgi:hypothetical protein
VLRAGPELNSGVEVTGGHTRDYDIDRPHRRGATYEGPRRSDTDVQVESVAQRHVHRAEAFTDRRGDRALESYSPLTNRGNQARGQRCPLLRQAGGAGLAQVPLERHAGRLEHPSRGRHDLRADPVAGYQRHAVHVSGSATCGALGEISADVAGWMDGTGSGARNLHRDSRVTAAISAPRPGSRGPGRRPDSGSEARGCR